MSQSKSLGRPLLLFLLAVGLAVAAFFFWSIASRTVQPDPLALRAVTLAWEANGALENEEYSVGTDENGKLIFGFQEAIPRYEEIQKLFPDEELAHRNLAITWLLILNSPLVRDQDPAEIQNAAFRVDKETARSNARKALEELLDRFDSSVGSYLYGFALQVFAENRTQQIEMVKQFHEAASQDRDHAPFWFMAATMASSFQDGSRQNEDVLGPIFDESLAELRRLEPDNLWVIRTTLAHMANKADPNLSNYWKSHRSTLERANFSTQNFMGTQDTYGSFGDYSQEFDALDAIIDSGDWPKIVNQVTGLTNSVAGKSPFVTDMAELQPNPLDYLLWHFSEELMQRAAAKESHSNSLVPVQFSLPDLPESIYAQPILDFSLADLDFDGHLDLFVLREKVVEVYLGPLMDLSATPRLSIPVDEGFRGIQAAFLGTVADSTGSGITRRLSESEGRKAGIAHVELPQILLWGDAGLAVFELSWEVDSGITFKKVEQHPSTQQWSIQRCYLVDYDQDADLDVVAVTDQGLKLLMNRSNNTFVDASQWLELPANMSPIVDVQIVDWNRDVYIDLLVQSENGEIGILENRHHGAFRYRSLGVPTSADRPGFAVAEIDGNASWDLVSQQGDKTLVQFSETKAWSRVNWMGQGSSSDKAAASFSLAGEILGPWQVGDFDNSGTQDFLLWKDGSLHFYPSQWHGSPLGQGARRVKVETSTASVALPSKPERGERGDFDGDGDLDVVILAEGKLTLLRNDGGNQNNWLTVVPMGRGDNMSRTNHLGIGSLFEARVGHQYFAETVTRPSVHIGLGKAERPNLARIIWSNGIPQVLLLPKGRQTIEMVCILKGSCPFVYVWDGEQWQFLSDCLWAAPIGLQAPSGGLVPTRNWEYLRLPPDSLGETDGTYRIMLTEELWEVAYFDHVRLHVIDHPAEIEIHINDKVGPPDIVQHRLYQVREKLPPRSAVDQTGRDVLPSILHEDQQFLKSFQHRVTQGYVESHELILDFDVAETDDYTLFLTGWIQPTDTSINVMLQQHPELSGPVFPALMVIGNDGQWQPASRPLGFPGGKTKTMAVPLQGLFPTADRRLKIVTSSEIYWDHVYIANTETEVAIVEQEAELVSARSYFRGTARRLPNVENGPEIFDATDLSTTSVWAPVAGQMPAHGDVRELLEEADDRLVVLGTGDAVELHFKVPSHPVPPGHRRTFLLYTVGYDKDADLHTVEGQQVGPLPFAAMQAYPEYRGGNPSVGRKQSWHRFWRQVQNPQVEHSEIEPKVPPAVDGNAVSAENLQE